MVTAPIHNGSRDGSAEESSTGAAAAVLVAGSSTGSPVGSKAGVSAGRPDGRPRPVRSRDPQAHPLPTGREEEWRFTPLRRLGGLLAGPDADATFAVNVEAPEPVTVEHVGVDDARVGRVLTPADRVSAFAMTRAEHAVVVTVPARRLPTPR